MGPTGVGWVLKIRDELPMGDIIRAVDAGVGPLAGAVVRGEDHLVVRNVGGRRAATAGRPSPSWSRWSVRRAPRRT